MEKQAINKYFNEIISKDGMLYNYYNNAPSQLSKDYIKLYIINNAIMCEAVQEDEEDYETIEWKQREEKMQELRSKFGIKEWKWEIEGFCNHLGSLGGRMYKAHCIKMINMLKNNKK